jgi:hypothetical protein
MSTIRIRLASFLMSFGVAAAGGVLMAGAAAAAPVSAACGNTSLAVSGSPPQGATGHGSFVVLFKNVTSSRCTLTGYPGLDALDGSGVVLAHAQRTPNGFMGGAAAITTVSIAPGGFASATAEWLNFNPTTTGDCTFSAAVAATPPNTTHTVHLPVSVSICQLQIHPTVPGTSGQGSSTPTGVPAGSGGLAATNGRPASERRTVLAVLGAALLLLGGVSLVRRRHEH